MKRLMYVVMVLCFVLLLSACDKKGNELVCKECDAQLPKEAAFCPQCGAEIVSNDIVDNNDKKQEFENGDMAINQNENDESDEKRPIENNGVVEQNGANNEKAPIIWTNCPIDITGGISGSSNSEIITLNIKNLTSQDIDSIKVLVAFEHTGYDNSKEYITGFHTVDDTVWANSSVKSIISGENYNFLEAQVFPVCIYYKNGNIWGDSSANYDVIIKNTRPFYIKHFAMNSSNNESYDYTEESEDLEDNSKDEYTQDNGNEWDYSSPNDGLGMLPDSSWDEGDWVYEDIEIEESERDLDGTVDYIEE